MLLRRFASCNWIFAAVSESSTVTSSTGAAAGVATEAEEFAATVSGMGWSPLSGAEISSQNSFEVFHLYSFPSTVRFPFS